MVFVVINALVVVVADYMRYLRPVCVSLESSVFAIDVRYGCYELISMHLLVFQACL